MQSESAVCHMLSSGTFKTMKWLSQVQRERERQGGRSEARVVRVGSHHVYYRMDPCHHTMDQRHRMSNPKSKPRWHGGSWVVRMCPEVHQFNERATRVGDICSRAAVYVWGLGIQQISVLSSPFCWNWDLSKKQQLIKRAYEYREASGKSWPNFPLWRDFLACERRTQLGFPLSNWGKKTQCPLEPL